MISCWTEGRAFFSLAFTGRVAYNNSIEIEIFIFTYERTKRCRSRYNVAVLS